LSTGFGIGWDDTDAKPIVDYIRDRGGGGMRANVGVAASGEKEGFGTYGADITIRANLGRFSSDGAFNWAVDGGKLWWQPNSLLRIGVANGPGGMNTPAAVDANLNVLDGDGLHFRVTPGFGLTIGASALYGKAVKDLDKLAYAFGVKYEAAGLFTAVANLKYDLSKEESAEKLDFAAGVDVGVLSLLKTIGFTKVAVDARTNSGLNGPNSYLAVGQIVNFGIGALSLGVNAKELFWMGEGDPGYMPIRIGGSVGYKVNDIVSLGVEGRYVIGNIPAWNYQKAGDLNDAAFTNKDAAALGVSPQVTFNVGPTIVVGYNLQKDMSKDTTGRTIQHLFYGQVQVNF
jgi:hypothetical protein